MAPPLTGAASEEGGGGPVTGPLAAPPHSGGSERGAHLPRSLMERWRQSPWRSTVLRAAGIIATMATLSAIGVWAIAAEPQREIRGATEAPGGTWLATEAEAPAPVHDTPAKERGARVPDESGTTHRGTPKAAARAEPEPSGTARAIPSGLPGITSDGRIVLNTAGAQELTQLPGVGPKRAEAILRLREKLGRFRRPTELLRVRGIGPKTLKRLLPRLVLDPPALDPPALDPPALAPTALDPPQHRDAPRANAAEG